MTEYVLSTSLVIEFANDDEDSGNKSMLKAEIDDRSDGYNSGSTSFRAGDEPTYLVYKTSDVTINLHMNTLPSPNGIIVGSYVPTAGEQEAFDLGEIDELPTTETRVIEEMLMFACADSAQLSYPLNGKFTYEWVGSIPEEETSGEYVVGTNGQILFDRPVTMITSIVSLGEDFDTTNITLALEGRLLTFNSPPSKATTVIIVAFFIITLTPDYTDAGDAIAVKTEAATVGVAMVTYPTSFAPFTMTNTPLTVNEKTSYTVLTVIAGSSSFDKVGDDGDGGDEQ